MSGDPNAAAAPPPVPHFSFPRAPEEGPKYPLLTVDASSRGRDSIAHGLDRIYDETGVTVTTKWSMNGKEDCDIDFDLEFLWVESEDTDTIDLCFHLSVAHAETRRSDGAHWQLKVQPLTTDMDVVDEAKENRTNVLCLEELLPGEIEFEPDSYAWDQGRVCENVKPRRYVAARYLLASSQILKELFPAVKKIVLKDETPITDPIPSDDDYLRMFVSEMAEIAEEWKLPMEANEEATAVEAGTRHMRPTAEDVVMYNEMEGALLQDNEGEDDYVVPDEVLKERVVEWLARGYAKTNMKLWTNWTTEAMKRLADKLCKGHYWRHLYYAEKLGAIGIDVEKVKIRQAELRKALTDRTVMMFFMGFLSDIKIHLSSRLFREWVNAWRLPPDKSDRESTIQACEWAWRSWGEKHGQRLSYPENFEKLLPRNWMGSARGDPRQGQMNLVFQRYKENYRFDIVFKNSRKPAQECTQTIERALPGLKLESLTFAKKDNGGTQPHDANDAGWTHPYDANDPRMYPQVQDAEVC